MRTKVKIRTAPGLLLSLMSLLGKSGLATPWGIIYVVPGRHRDRRLIAAALGLAPDAVNIKAKTAEKLGPVGQGLAIEARAVVLLQQA